MDDKPINLEEILKQASRWTFAGDFTLLQWMKQISQDLETRATKTTEALAELDNNVKSTNIALDNVANRLTTLQFGNQYVEYRVQDDDETLISGSESRIKNENQSEQIASKDLLKTFLNNNLKVLRNCHEKYSIDLEDSDDEETSQEKTCIYQPINPYNEKPLPYIFGSKDWHSKWHVGLYESQQENSYSGDEISEEYSESSSTSHSHLDDNESFESNTEWVSSNSIDNDNLNANIEVKNASSLRGSQPLYPGTPLPVTAVTNKVALSESSSISTPPSSLAKKSLPTPKQNEHLNKRSESINSISSKISPKTRDKLASIHKGNTLQYTAASQKFVDLFAEPSVDVHSATSSSVSSASNIVRLPPDNREIEKENPPAFKTQPPPFVDLFVEPPEDVISAATSSMFSKPNTRRTTINLFDDLDDNPTNEDFLSGLSKKEELGKSKSKEKPMQGNSPAAAVKRSKSLFDDSEEDDDFLKAFEKKSLPKEVTKTALFDSEVHEPITTAKLRETDSDSGSNTTVNKKPSQKMNCDNKIPNIFKDTGYNENVLLFNKTATKETAISITKTKLGDVFQLPSATSKPISKLFDNPVVDENAQLPINAAPNNSANFTSHKISKKINLFDDLDEEDEWFVEKPKRNDILPQNFINHNRETNEAKLFKTLEDVAATTRDPVDEISKNQLKETSHLETKNFIYKETERNKSNEVVGKDHNVLLTVAADNEPLPFDNDQVMGVPNQEKYPQVQEESTSNKSATVTQDKLISLEANVTNKPISSNKYDLNSVLFLDEPPEDDDEFFANLTSEPSTLNNNYNGIDLENDIYEPELPQVPVSAVVNNPTTDATESFYTGLQLFSDTPPDDDDDDVDADANADCSDGTAIATNLNQTTSLHSVFYDDFNETLMALNEQQTEKKIRNNFINNDEPPAMDELSISASIDLTDHKVPEDKQHLIWDAAQKTKTPLVCNDNTLEYSHKRPISKLQMPNININIQALLPGANNNTLRKIKEDKIKSNIVINPYDVDVKDDSNAVTESLAKNINISKPHLVDMPTVEAQRILPSVTKNRVKAPAARRPSTRKARQESYRKSFIEQQNQTWEREDEVTKIPAENNIFTALKPDMKTYIPQTSNGQDEQTKAVKVRKQNVQKETNYIFKGNHNSSNATTTSKTTKLFEDEPLEGISNKNKIESSRHLKERVGKESSLLFDDDDDEDDDDDFFKHIKTREILDAKKETEAKEPAREANAAISITTQMANNTNIEITKEIPIPPSLEGAEKQYETNQQDSQQLTAKTFKTFLDSEDEEDDLFKATLQRQTNINRDKQRNNQAKLQFKSFLDSETDEESTIAAPTTTITTTPTATKASTYSSKICSTSIPNVSTATPTNNKLFSDSETDSDDLFGNLSATKSSSSRFSTESAPKSETKTLPQYSLFGDESDSDDNFLASSVRVNKNNKTFKSPSKKSVAKSTPQTNASLFSDLDDSDDDLFGAGAMRKVSTTNPTHMQKIETPATSKPSAAVIGSSKSQIVDDNPLADLL